MSLFTAYLLNVALHAAFLSVIASLVLMALREARHRSVAAITGLLAVAVLPWISALRPGSENNRTETRAEINLPTWTVVTLPAASHETGSVSPSAFIATDTVFPDPAKSAIVIWAAGSVIGLALLGFAWLRVLLWRKSLEPIDDRSWEKLRSAIPDVGDRSRFLIIGQSASPCVTGVLKPRIVIPRFLLAESNDPLAWAVRHELAHLRAGDSRWTMLFAIVRCVNWWNPFVHHLVLRWVDARERLCDLHAAGVSETRADYGKFLVSMAGRVESHPPLNVAMAHRRHALVLKARIVSLLDAKEDSARPAGKRFAGLACCAVLACASLVSCLRIGGAGKEGARTEEASSVGKSTSKIQTHSSPVPEADRQNLVTIPGGNPLQIMITSKLIEAAPDVDLTDGETYNDNQVQRIMRKLAQKRGTSLITMPIAVARPGQPTTMEILREVPGTARQIATRDGKSPLPWAGIRLSFVPRLANESIVDLEWSADYRFVPGVWPSAGKESKPPADLNPDKIVVLKRASSSPLSSGKAICANLGETESGKFLTLLITAEIVDATGRPLKSS